MGKMPMPPACPARSALSPSRPPACDLLDASRFWNNPVHADGVIIPSK